MADISQLEVNGTTYDICDATARDDKADIDHTILGHYSVADPNEDYAVVIGNGTGDAARSNAFTVGWDGKVCNYVDGMSTSSIPDVSPTYYGVLSAIDGDGAERGLLRLGDFSSGNQAFQILTRRNINGTDVNNAITLGIGSNGSRYLSLSDPSIWQNVLFEIENDGMNIGYNQTISADASNNIKTVDQNGKTAAQIVFKETASGTKQVLIQAHGYDSSNNDVWNSLAVNILKDGRRSYTITDPNAFLSTLGLGNCTTYNTVSNYFTANTTNIKDVAGSLQVWGKVAMLYLNFKNKSAISVPANGNITNLNLGTLKEGFRPKTSLYTCGGDTGAGINSYYLTSNGTVELAASDSTGAARTIAADSTFCVGITYLLL